MKENKVGAEMNRYGVEDERASRERISDPLGPEFCAGRPVKRKQGKDGLGIELRKYAIRAPMLSPDAEGRTRLLIHIVTASSLRMSTGVLPISVYTAASASRRPWSRESTPRAARGLDRRRRLRCGVKVLIARA